MTQLFPIHLTTPEVICNLFEGRDECFDLLIFDEASQVELQDSATCLLKGTSIVVAGDEHQMPPSNYFKGSNDHLYEEDDEDEYTGADIEVESLLNSANNSRISIRASSTSTTAPTTPTSSNSRIAPSIQGS